MYSAQKKESAADGTDCHLTKRGYKEDVAHYVLIAGIVAPEVELYSKEEI